MKNRGVGARRTGIGFDSVIPYRPAVGYIVFFLPSWILEQIYVSSLNSKTVRLPDISPSLWFSSDFSSFLLYLF
jgi:hypothetical protein